LKRARWLLKIVCSLFILGCQPLRKHIFEWSGLTLDSSVVTTSLKELHLAGLVESDTNVLISGKVTEAGRAGTYVVIEEGGSQILVDVTNSDQIVAATFLGKTLQVYGRLEDGKKGLPLVVATGVRELR
jgi:hypothetical protein